MINLLSSELFRMRKRFQSWLLLYISIGLMALIYGGMVIVSLLTKGADGESLRNQVTFTSFTDTGVGLGVGFFAGVMLMIIGAGMMGNEYAWNPLRPLVARSTSRSALLGSKVLALVIYSAIFVAAFALVTAVMFVVGPMVVDRPSGFSITALGDGLGYAYRLLFAMSPYIALAFMLSTLFRSNAAGIAGALAVNFIEGPIFMLLGFASSFFERMSEWGIMHNVQAVAPYAGAPWDVRSTLVVLAYTVGFIAIAFIVFLRRDVTSG